MGTKSDGLIIDIIISVVIKYDISLVEDKLIVVIFIYCSSTSLVQSLGLVPRQNFIYNEIYLQHFGEPSHSQWLLSLSPKILN